jgi:hypothetical protein
MRDYDPTTGRYLQAGPLGLVDGPSVYGYARQSPVRWTDRLGLFTIADAYISLLGREFRIYSKQEVYDEWLRLERENTDWLKELPRCPRTLDECRGEEWEEVGPANQYHRPGVFELRSKPTPGGHATQCVYNPAGQLILDIPAAGSADYKAFEGLGLGHSLHDVLPYERALQLGGKNVGLYYEVKPRQ